MASRSIYIALPYLSRNELVILVQVFLLTLAILLWRQGWQAQQHLTAESPHTLPVPRVIAILFGSTHSKLLHIGGAYTHILAYTALGIVLLLSNILARIVYPLLIFGNIAAFGFIILVRR